VYLPKVRRDGLPLPKVRREGVYLPKVRREGLPLPKVRRSRPRPAAFSAGASTAGRTGMIVIAGVPGLENMSVS
jgi:hypothetical protein